MDGEPGKKQGGAAPREPHLLHDGVGDGLEVHGALVRQVVEDVGGADRLGPALLVAENQVDPLMQLTGHELRLQRLQETKQTSLYPATGFTGNKNLSAPILSC